MAKEINAEKSKDKPKNAGKSKDKEKKRGKVGRSIKETFSELKKVTWPSFGTVVKQTGIVLAVVLAFLLVLICFDQLLGWLYKMLVSGLNDVGSTAQAAVSLVASGGTGIPLWL